MRIFALRQCTDYTRALYMRPGAGEARVARVTIAVAVFSVRCSLYPSRDGPAATSSPTSTSIVKERCCPRSISESSISECQTV